MTIRTILAKMSVKSSHLTLGPNLSAAVLAQIFPSLHLCHRPLMANSRSTAQRRRHHLPSAKLPAATSLDAFPTIAGRNVHLASACNAKSVEYEAGTP